MPKKMVLSDHTLKKLIREVRKRECLWNPQHDRYNDRYQMAKSWIEIANVMQLPEERLRVKWKNLRDLYKKEIKKFGSGDQYTGKWRHFKVLNFINQTTDNAKNNGNVLDKTNENDESPIQAKEEQENDDEFEFEVDEHEQEGNNEVEVYLDEEAFDEDPIPDKIAKLSDEDYDLMFLKSLAPYFRQLEPIRKLVVRSKMQDMLLNEIAAQSSASYLKKS